MRTFIACAVLLTGVQAASAQSADRYRGGWRTDDADPHTYEFSIRGERVRGIYNQDRLVVNKLVYLGADPAIGDIVMLRYPRDPRKTFVSA